MLSLILLVLLETIPSPYFFLGRGGCFLNPLSLFSPEEENASCAISCSHVKVLSAAFFILIILQITAVKGPVCSILKTLHATLKITDKPDNSLLYEQVLQTSENSLCCFFVRCTLT